MIVFPDCPQDQYGKLQEHDTTKCLGVLVPLSSSARVIYVWKCTVCGHEIK